MDVLKVVELQHTHLMMMMVIGENDDDEGDVEYKLHHYVHLHGVVLLLPLLLLRLLLLEPLALDPFAALARKYNLFLEIFTHFLKIFIYSRSLQK